MATIKIVHTFKCRKEFLTSRLVRQGYHSPVNQIVMTQINLIEAVHLSHRAWW